MSGPTGIVGPLVRRAEFCLTGRDFGRRRGQEHGRLMRPSRLLGPDDEDFAIKTAAADFEAARRF
ncbi:hypothetical protein ACWCXH_12615 [Kitasatospora sp. NPDC001660]